MSLDAEDASELADQTKPPGRLDLDRDKYEFSLLFRRCAIRNPGIPDGSEE